MTITIPVQILWAALAVAAWWLTGWAILAVILARVPGMALGLPRHTLRAMRWGGPLLVVAAIRLAADRREADRIRAETTAEREAAGLAGEPRIF